MIAYFARHPTAANLVMLVFLLVGALALPDLQRETYPEFEANAIRIRASYPGADAQTMDETVVARIEDVLAGLEGIDALRSTASEGGATVNVEVGDGVSIEDLLAEIKSAVDAIRDFPTDMDPPTVTAQSRARSVVTVAVSGPMSGQDLKLYLERLKRRLLAYDEVSLVSIAGFSPHQLRVRVDDGALERYGLDLGAVATAVAAQSLDTPLGQLQTRGRTLLVRYTDKRTDPEALRDVVIAAPATGGEVRLRDVATVEDAFSVDEEQTYFNGERAGMLVVSKATTQDSLEVLAAVKEFIAEQEQVKPEGVRFSLTNDSTSVIDDRLALLITNGVQGLILVFITMWLFFDARLAFWVSAGLPVSFLGALWLMNATGQTLNMMTMMGLLVALGLLMDDAIVLAENVATHLQRGASPMNAAIDGVREVAGGVVSSFLTTICVFVPLSAIDGRIGRTLQVIPAVLIAVLAVSLVEAFFVLPNHLGHSIRVRQRRNAGRERIDAAFEWVRERVVGRVTDLAIRFRYLAVGLTLAAFVIAMGLLQSGRLAYQAFPDTEGDVVEFRLEMPLGTTFEQTKRQTERVVQAARDASDALAADQPPDQALVKSASVRFNYNPDVEEVGPHVATVTIDLLGVEVRGTTLAEFTDQWREALGPIPDAVSARFGAGGRRGPGGNPIEVRIEGDDLQRLDEVADAVKVWFSGFSATSDLADDLEPGTPQVRIRLREGAGSTGLTGALVAQQLRTALSGVSIETLHRNGEQYELFVELEQLGRDTLADIEYFPIRLADGATLPLGSIARVDVGRGFARIARTDGTRTVTVTGNVDRDQLNLAMLMEEFVAEQVPELESRWPDVRIAIGGEIEDSNATNGSMARGMVLGLFAIFILLSIQFRTYIEPLLVMLAIPFAFVGVVFGSLAIGAPLSSQSVLGFASLAGVVVNDSILLMVFIKKRTEEGEVGTVAAAAASRDRFRAVLLTSATTVMGLVPLMFETSRQAQMLIPVATSISFGIMASTVLVLVVIPAAYAVLADLGLAGKREPLT